MRMVRNHGLAGGTIADKKLGAPAPAVIVHEHCDVDQACDRAKYEILINKLNLFEGTHSLFFCGHHYREHEQAFIERGYGVKKL